MQSCCVIDAEYRVLWSNRQAFGAEALGKHCYAIYRDRSSPCPRCPVRDALTHHRPCVMEKSYRMVDGSRRRGKVLAYPVHDPASRRPYVLKLGQDMAVAPSGGTAAQPGLTPRERQVLGLLAQGRTNPEISRELAISRHTVKTHVTSIFTKLGVKNRAQAALQAAHLDLP